MSRKNKTCGSALVDGGLADAGIGLGAGYAVAWMLEKMMFKGQDKKLVGGGQGAAGVGLALLGSQMGYPVVGLAAGVATAARGVDNIVTALAEAHVQKTQLPATGASGLLDGPAKSPLIVRDDQGTEYAYIKAENTETLVSKITGDTVAVNTPNQKLFEIGSDGIVRQVNQPNQSTKISLAGPDEIGPQDVVGIVL